MERIVKMPITCMDESCETCPLLEVEVRHFTTSDDFFGEREYNYNCMFCKNVNLCERLSNMLSKAKE